ncbi:matrixin family metalloprotease [Metaplanococcus flavidus]|uniref:Matrixin family metalloprotease n=1 Tax=Metaplanococcus flavidus TaxID=569883 RepID=A0ABW3LGN7_9BACL
MKKVILLSLILSVLLSGKAYAGDLGMLSYYYSDSSSIARYKSSPLVYFGSLDSSVSGTQLSTMINHATNQWTNGGVRVTTTTRKDWSNIEVYAGNLTSLRTIYPSYDSSNTGLMRPLSTAYEGEWRYAGTYIKNGFQHLRTQVLIKNRTETNLTTRMNYYRKTATHEIGHALGWRGHSSSSNDIMYSSSSAVQNLTTRDKVHLNQIY